MATAIERMMRDETGAVYSAYVDLATLQPVADLAGYDLIEIPNVEIEDVPLTDIPFEAFQTAPAGSVPPEAKTIGEVKEIIMEGGKLDAPEAPTGMNERRRDMTNNFGYIDKPGFLDIASKVPGPIGAVGKFANTVINAENQTARAEARKAIGLEPEYGFIDQVKGLVKDVGPNVAEDVNIGGTQYDVAQGGIDKKGRLALTPNEARQRSMVLDAPIADVSKTKKNEETPVSERGFGLRPAMETSVPESTKSPGTLGATPENTDTGTRQGLAGRYADVTPTEVGTTPDAGFARDQMPDISAPLGVDPENEAAQTSRMKETVTQSPVAPSTVETKSTFSSQPSKSIQAGKGFANLTSPESEAKAAENREKGTRRSSVGFDPDYSARVSEEGIGPGRYATPEDAITGKVSNVVGTTLGPDYTVDISSGTYSPEQREAISTARDEAERAAIERGASASQARQAGAQAAKAAGQVGSGRHTTGLAMDFGIVDPTGQKVTDPKTLGKVAEALGAAGVSGVGYGPGYMGANIHADVVSPDRPGAWGALGKAALMDPSLHEAVTQAQREALQQQETISGYKEGIATPLDKPGIGSPVSPTTPTSDAIANTPTGPLSPASATALGMGRQYTPEEKTAMAETIAGELGPQSLRGLTVDDPEAVAEAAGILGTIDNRVNSVRNASAPSPLGATLTPSQYNALSPAAMGTTAANYRSFAPEVTKAVDNYTQGTTPSTTPNASHYANMDIASPAWGGAPGSKKVGAHEFSKPDQTFSPDEQGFGTSWGPVAAQGLGPIGPSAQGTFGIGAPSNPVSDLSQGVTADYSAPSGAPPGIGPTSNPATGVTSDVGVSGVSQGSKGLGASPAGPTGPSNQGDSTASDGTSGTDGTSKGDGAMGGGLGGLGGIGSSTGMGGRGVGNSPGGQTGFGGMAGPSSSPSDKTDKGPDTKGDK